MKQRISVSVDEETVLKIQKKLRQGFFRNKSHVVEYAIQKLEEENAGRS